MAITLKGDNRQLTKNAKFSYLADNYASGVSVHLISNSNGFAANDYVLLSEWSFESAEIMKVQSVDTSAHQLTYTANTKFAHSESTRVTIIQYNQIRFYHTTTTTYGTSDPVTGYVDLQPDSNYSRTIDSTNATGYGWFVFYNATTGAVSANSNAIPYAGFDEESIKEIFDAFWSLLNNKEKKLITDDDAFRWLNEGYSIAKNELNLVNPEYAVPAQATISAVSGTAEYDLAADFSDMVNVTDTDGEDVPYANIKDIHYIRQNSTGVTAHYYVRNKKIGFVPTPTTSATYYYYYRSKTTKLTSYYDSVDLPDNNFYCLVDFMMYRASQKLTRPSPETHLQLFQTAINRMKLTSNKQNSNQDSWSIADEANV